MIHENLLQLFCYNTKKIKAIVGAGFLIKKKYTRIRVCEIMHKF